MAVLARLARVAATLQLLGEIQIRPAPGLHFGPMLGSGVEVWASKAVHPVDAPDAQTSPSAMAEYDRVVGVPPVEHSPRGLVATGDELALFDERIDARVGALQRALAETDEELLVELEALLLRHERVVLGRLRHPVASRAMVQGDLSDHRCRHAVLMARRGLASMAVQMAANLEWLPFRIAELEIADHKFDENVRGVKRHRAAAPLEEVTLRPQAMGFLAFRR
ncbi:MAG: hypothetical protein JO023_22240, partial [Chloroflexi bacterium]|nr:hypothetical protein [Chloroflexota bacterium]